MPNQTIAASGTLANPQSLLSGKSTIKGDGQNNNRAQGNGTGSADAVDGSAGAANAADPGARAEDVSTKDGQSPFERLLEQVSPNTGRKSTSKEAGDGDSASSTDETSQPATGLRSVGMTVQQLLAEAGFGPTTTPEAPSTQLAGKTQDAAAIMGKAQWLTGTNEADASNARQVDADGVKGAKADPFASVASSTEPVNGNRKPQQVTLGTLEQLTRASGTGSINAQDLRDQSVDVRTTSAFDTVLPIVKEAILTPTQRAQGDGFSVLKQETHFAPVDMVETLTGAQAPSGLSLADSVMKQIGDAISKGLDTPTTRSDGASSSNSAEQPTSALRLHRSGDLLRVLDIQLHPADLGKVRLSVRLNDNNVEVRIEASKAETAKMLQSNQGELNRLLQRAGYQADHISVVAVDDRGSSQILPPSTSDSLGQQAGQDKSAFSGFNNGSGAGNGADQRSAAGGDGTSFHLDGMDETSDGADHESQSGTQPYRGLTL
nr:flagellar hook-length control protein FliK [uncultured Cohaesibacter sp.]